MASRLKALENILTNNTVLDEWFTPAKNALKKKRYSDKIFTTLSMSTFILQKCVRQLNNCVALRDHLQHLFHLDDEATVIQRARSTHSEALSSNIRLEIVSKAAEHLVLSTTKILPDRLSGIEGLGGRSIYGMDGT